MQEEKACLQQEAEKLAQQLQAVLSEKFVRQGTFDAETPIDKTLGYLQSVISVSAAWLAAQCMPCTGSCSWTYMSQPGHAPNTVDFRFQHIILHCSPRRALHAMLFLQTVLACASAAQMSLCMCSCKYPADANLLLSLYKTATANNRVKSQLSRFPDDTGPQNDRKVCAELQP